MSCTDYSVFLAVEAQAFEEVSNFGLSILPATCLHWTPLGSVASSLWFKMAVDDMSDDLTCK